MKKFIVITLFALVCLPAFAFAQATGTGGATGSGGGATGTGGQTTVTPPSTSNTITWTIKPPFRDGIGSDITSIIEVVMRNIVMPLASILVVLAILYSGFKFVIAQGNPKEIEEARRGLIWVLIGSLILLGAYGISGALKDTVNQIVPLP